ncbi:peptidoglycan DD-metalloendopeptidase family protein [Patescibacteria group bacterium]|nr:peptidoglycan DD-metalloendopeptidase family protein [Patescibacteria group bacterium]
MKNKITLLFLIPVLGFLFFTFSNSGQAQSDLIDKEINSLNLKIQNQKQQIEDIKVRQAEYQKEIEARIKDRVSLNNQLAIIENRLAKAALDIESTNIEIDKTSLEIKKVKLDSESLDKRIEEQKDHISNLLKLVYKQDQVTTLEMLLLNDSLADFLNANKYLSDTNREIGESVNQLKYDKLKLEEAKLSLEKKNEELLSLKSQLENRKLSLAYEQENKTYILEETKSSEKQYQALLQEAKQQQLQAERDIANAEQLIRQKMSEKDKEKLESGGTTIAWPVPKNIITAGFYDSSYPYKNIIGEHPAVDIRAKQGTTITAAADGYVAKVKFDGNKNYAYIMLIHAGGLSTVYGHVSAVYVTQDQYVSQGQAIGKTGGTPGTTGAGRFSTGPHLHFEVRLNGLPVNPEKYLP